MAGALGVVITTDVPMSGQHAQPVYVDESLPIVGPSQAIVVTSGEVPQMGGPPLAIRLAPAGTPALGPALPVYVVAGSLSSGPAVSPPVNSVLPVVSGTTELGQTLSTTDGTWTGSPAFTYQWYRNGVAIGGATNNTYVLVSADLGTTITSTVTATNAGGSAAATSAGTPIMNYLILDRFTTNQASPIGTPRTAEPGPGSWTVVDTGNKVSIASNRLTFLSTTTVTADPRLSDVSRATTPGRVLALIINSAAGGQPEAGWGTAAMTDASQHGLIFGSSALHIYELTVQILSLSAFTANTDYTIALIQRYNGMLVIIQGGAQFPSAALFWVTGADFAATALLTARLCTFQGAGPGRFDDVVMLDYGGEWSKHYPYASVSTLLPATLSTAVMPADAVIEIEWKALSGETMNVAVRYVDDSNHWLVRLVQSTSTFSLVEVNAGVETVRAGPTALASGTITASDWIRTLIKCNAARIDIQTKDVNSGSPNRALNYTSATFQQTATGVKLMTGTTFYGLAIWPIALAAPSPAQLSSITPLNVLAIGDSRTNGSADASQVPLVNKAGYLFWLWSTVEASRGAGAYERPTRIGHSGFTTAQLKAAIDADLAAAVGTPNVVVLNIGVNDLPAMPVEATFKTNFAYILDAIHTKYPSAPIAISLVWAIGEDADSATWATWANFVISTRPYVVIGCNEAITLKAGDNGAARMANALHPNTLGHQDLAAAYKTALGL